MRETWRPFWPLTRLHPYYLAGAGNGFFIELSQEHPQDRLMVMRSFEQPDLLANYIAEYYLPTGC